MNLSVSYIHLSSLDLFVHVIHVIYRISLYLFIHSISMYICLEEELSVPAVPPSGHHGCHSTRTVLHRFEGGALRSLHFTAAGEIHCLLCAAPWYHWKTMAFRSQIAVFLPMFRDFKEKFPYPRILETIEDIDYLHILLCSSILLCFG